MLHIRQNYNYVTVEHLLIPNEVLLFETLVHYLAWYYFYKKAGANKYFNYFMIFLALISYVTASPLFGIYYSNSIHEKVAIFLSISAFSVLFHYSCETYFGLSLPAYLSVVFFITSHIVLLVVVQIFTYDLFVKLFHFVELMVSTFYIGFWLSREAVPIPSKRKD